MARATNDDGSPTLGRRARRGGPSEVDAHVGSRVRQRRTLLGLSQERLAEALGLTFQQVQKYERGSNRIGASRLHQLAQALQVPVAYFFEEMPAENGADGTVGRGFAEAREGFDAVDPLVKRETLELVRAYYRIPDHKVRKRLFELTKTLGRSGDLDP